MEKFKLTNTANRSAPFTVFLFGCLILSLHSCADVPTVPITAPEISEVEGIVINKADGSAV